MKLWNYLENWFWNFKISPLLVFVSALPFLSAKCSYPLKEKRNKNRKSWPVAAPFLFHRLKFKISTQQQWVKITAIAKLRTPECFWHHNFMLIILAWWRNSLRDPAWPQTLLALLEALILFNHEIPLDALVNGS